MVIRFRGSSMHKNGCRTHRRKGSHMDAQESGVSIFDVKSGDRAVIELKSAVIQLGISDVRHNFLSLSLLVVPKRPTSSLLSALNDMDDAHDHFLAEHAEIAKSEDRSLAEGRLPSVITICKYARPIKDSSGNKKATNPPASPKGKELPVVHSLTDFILETDPDDNSLLNEELKSMPPLRISLSLKGKKLRIEALKSIPVDRLVNALDKARQQSRLDDIE